MIRLFCGYDPRESAGFHTFVHSVISKASQPVAIIPISGEGMRPGSNLFTLSRFLVPSLCHFRGRAIFCDASDMLALADLTELDELFDPRFAVQVVKHPDYESMHSKKYIGTPMESGQSNYSRKNWASVMLLNCEHPAWQKVTPGYVAGQNHLRMLQFSFLCDWQVGSLTREWNVLADEGQGWDAKILHWTAGMPGFDHYKDAPRSESWHEARRQMNS